MNYIGKTALLIGVSLGITGIVPTQAHAAKWHKGTPTAMRGIWQSTIPHKKLGMALGFAPAYTITKTRLQGDTSGMTSVMASRMKWHRSGKVYYLRGYVKKIGMITHGGWTTFKFYRVSKKYIYDDTYSHKLKAGYRYKKVHKIVNYKDAY